LDPLTWRDIVPNPIQAQINNYLQSKSEEKAKHLIRNFAKEISQLMDASLQMHMLHNQRRNPKVRRHQQQTQITDYFQLVMTSRKYKAKTLKGTWKIREKITYVLSENAKSEIPPAAGTVTYRKGVG